MLAAVLVTTAAATLAVSHFRIFEFDEMLSYWTDTAPTARSVIWIQAHYPISLDPPAYHLLSHWSMQWLGRGAFALRLPALLSFLLMQVCLFELVRRLAGARAGIVAAIFPLLTASSTYAGDGRPYAVMLACNAVALLCWYLGKFAETTARQYVAKAILAVALFVCVQVHFFGVLILIPIFLAETTDSLEHRRIDFSMVAALCFGLISAGLLLPFKHGVAPYAVHYYNGYLGWPLIPQAYRFMITGIYDFKIDDPPWAIMVVCLLALAIGWVSVLRRPAAVPLGLWVAVLALGLLPFFGYAFAQLLVHTMEVRHVLPTLVALSILIGVWLAPLWKSRLFPAVIVAGLACVSYVGFQRVQAAKQDTHRLLDAIAISESARSFLVARPESRVYIQNFGLFLYDVTYTSDPSLAKRLTLVYDEPREFRWKWNTTFSISSEFIPHFTPFHAVPLDDALADPNGLFVVTSAPNSWLTDELAAEGYHTTWIAKAFGEGIDTIERPAASSLK